MRSARLSRSTGTRATTAARVGLVAAGVLQPAGTPRGRSRCAAARFARPRPAQPLDPPPQRSRAQDRPRFLGDARRCRSAAHNTTPKRSSAACSCGCSEASTVTGCRRTESMRSRRPSPPGCSPAEQLQADAFPAGAGVEGCTATTSAASARRMNRACSPSSALRNAQTRCSLRADTSRPRPPLPPPSAPPAAAIPPPAQARRGRSRGASAAAAPARTAVPSPPAASAPRRGP